MKQSPGINCIVPIPTHARHARNQPWHAASGRSQRGAPAPQAWLANCLHPGARVVTAKDVVLAPVADHAGAEKEKKPRGGGRPRGAAPGGEPVDYAAHEVVPPPEGWRREVIPRKSVQGADAYYYSPAGSA